MESERPSYLIASTRARPQRAGRTATAHRRSGVDNENDEAKARPTAHPAQRPPARAPRGGRAAVHCVGCGPRQSPPGHLAPLRPAPQSGSADSACRLAAAAGGGRRAWRVAWPPRPSTGRSSSTEPHSQRGARERNSWPNTIPGRPIPPLSPHRTASKVYLDQLISEASCAGAWCTRYTLTNPASRPRGSPPRRH